MTGGSGFKDFVYELNPKFKILNRQKIAAGIWDLFLVEKAKIMSVIGNHKVSITTDTWTSIQNINYMVVTTHFMDSDGICIKIPNHKGVDIDKTLCACLNAWGIEKLFSITVDNTSANDGAVVYVENRMKDFNDLLLDGKYLHLRCACHILNLIVKDGLKQLLSFKVHSSPSRLDSFRDHALEIRMDGMANVPMDVVTRWNSTYKMLDCAFKYKIVFNKMATENVAFQAYFEEIEKDGMKIVGPPSNED
ncbi:PREDICTED: zinc finger BED domain-containing [Prunus dulcis]|uniref:PREDICTED: zinc finger BED domain-containing n=1 Tax=Prunus dulcis TaxID=3755 RepID=A0A5E4G0L4_PRUDU|nr:PREDICTED: zinc finger BED domain-containing [Prunus dulcis]